MRYIDTLTTRANIKHFRGIKYSMQNKNSIQIGVRIKRP